MTPGDSVSDPDIAYQFAFAFAPIEQTTSPLFRLLPGELRDRIWEYALSDYEDTTKLYEDTTCYKRPGYLAPRRTDTELLRTCQAVYSEAWFRPWTSAKHTFWLTNPERKPRSVTRPNKMSQILDLVQKRHGEVPVIEDVRIFAQLFLLEPGVRLSEILSMDTFHPKRVTITLRHTDWWHWEDEEPMHIRSDFVERCRLPDSVKEVRMELETLERRKEQLDSIAEQMANQWQFTRKDGTRLAVTPFAQAPPKVTRWTGTSAWNGERWIRDESRPGELDFYMLTVVWRVLQHDAELPDPPQKASQIWAERSTHKPMTGAVGLFRSLSMREMEQVGVGLNTNAQEAIRLITEARRTRATELRAQRSDWTRRSRRLNPRP